MKNEKKKSRPLLFVFTFCDKKDPLKVCKIHE